MLIIILTTYTGFLDQYQLHDTLAYMNKVESLKRDGWTYRDVNKTPDSTVTVMYKYSVTEKTEEVGE